MKEKKRRRKKMPVTKKQTFTDIELQWAEEQLLSWKAYVDAHPFNELEDRIKWKEVRGGGTMPIVIASIEQQGKFIQETIKNYLNLLQQVETMRKADETKQIQARGNQTLTPMEQGEI
jgi:hypothetical protein